MSGEETNATPTHEEIVLKVARECGWLHILKAMKYSEIVDLKSDLEVILSEIETADVDDMATCLVGVSRGINFRSAGISYEGMPCLEKEEWRRLARAAIEHIPYLKGRYA